MKNKTIFFLSLIVIISFIFSCKKDKPAAAVVPPPQAVTYSNYSALAIGNYWVYQEFDVDSLGNATPKNVYDSCYVVSDTVINSKTYYKMFRPSVVPSWDYTFLRDSLSYIVNSSGQIQFSSVDFTTLLVSKYDIATPGDTVCKIVKQMTDQNMSVTTAAGTFVTSNAKEMFYMYPNWASHGNPRHTDARYAQNVGIVIETLPFFASNPNYIERRLVRYHVN